MTKTHYKAILADLDGTVNRGDVLISGVESIYRDLSERGVQWLFLVEQCQVVGLRFGAEAKEPWNPGFGTSGHKFGLGFASFCSTRANRTKVHGGWGGRPHSGN